jgi:ferrochelatase
MKLAVVLFNLGGPDSLDAVQPFLMNLFDDPAIIRLPAILRRPLARRIAARRAPITRAIYARIGGQSPILGETEAQAHALERMLAGRGYDAKCFIAMRYWRPTTTETVRTVKAWGPDAVVALPLYPQFSTATTASSYRAWWKSSAAEELSSRQSAVCCFPWDRGFIAAIAGLLMDALARRRGGIDYRILFSAHGLPKRIIAKGDPYQWQVEQTVAHILGQMRESSLDSTICYQSRVGPLKWIGPATDTEVRRAGAEKKGLIVVPVAFVSEHSETLVELDMDYAKLAEDFGVPDYMRVPAVRTQPTFIAGLAELVERALTAEGAVTCAARRLCPVGKICLHGKMS